jgi:hypothetical protein
MIKWLMTILDAGSEVKKHAQYEWKITGYQA